MATRKKSSDKDSDQAKVIDGTVLGPTDVLVGSNLLPSLVDVGGEEPIQLGEVVKSAHALSGLSVEAWNAQPDADREQYLADAVDAIRAAVGSPASNSNTEGGPAAGAPAGELQGGAEGGTAEPAAQGAAAAPVIVQPPVVEDETVTAYVREPVRFGGKKRLPGRPHVMPTSVFTDLQAKGLIEEDD